MYSKIRKIYFYITRIITLPIAMYISFICSKNKEQYDEAIRMYWDYNEF
jgi:transposase